jgi:ring-1,2-phenylacetyl-CoA epoxidase subunit PaaC
VSELFETASDAEATARAVAAAAPEAPERVDTSVAQALDPALRQPMRNLLASLADNKYILGRRYAEWCTGAPMLESAVAAAAMAQDELGHARSFYPLLRGLGEVADEIAMEERGWQQRPTRAMSSLEREFGTWIDFIAANVLIDSALTTLLSAAVDSPFEPLRQRARKIVQEEGAHWVHGSGWLRRLKPDPAALASMRDDAMTFFGQRDDPTLAPLVKAGILAEDSDALRERLRIRLTPLLTDVGHVEILDRPLPWDRWDPTTRQLRR